MGNSGHISETNYEKLKRRDSKIFESVSENIWKGHFIIRKIRTTTIYVFPVMEAGIILIFRFFQVRLGAGRLDGPLKNIVDGNKFQVCL